MRITAIILLAGLLIITGCGETETPRKVGESGAAPTSQQQQQRLKQPQKFKIGDIIEIGELWFTVNGVREDKGNQFFRPPQGKRWIVVDVTIQNVSDQPTVITEYFEFMLADSEGRRYRPDIFVPGLKGELGGELAAGGKMRGEVAFEVPIGAKGFELIFDPTVFGFGQAIVVLDK